LAARNHETPAGSQKMIGLDIGQIADLTTQVATAGAVRIADMVDDGLFDLIIAIALLIYEIDPGPGN
jgi:hypothetical protein